MKFISLINICHCRPLQGLNFMRMSARVDGVASRVQSAIQMRNVTNSMAGVVKSMDSALKSMNLEKVRDT